MPARRMEATTLRGPSHLATAAHSRSNNYAGPMPQPAPPARKHQIRPACTATKPLKRRSPHCQHCRPTPRNARPRCPQPASLACHRPERSPEPDLGRGYPPPPPRVGHALLHPDVQLPTLPHQDGPDRPPLPPTHHAALQSRTPPHDAAAPRQPTVRTGKEAPPPPTPAGPTAAREEEGRGVGAGGARVRLPARGSGRDEGVSDNHLGRYYHS
nr:formin-like protein 20 [Aegilops tauschii subsp. strangulata]